MTVIDLKTGYETKLSAGLTLSCAVGNFDGVHTGHGALLTLAKDKENADLSGVWTFRVHPRICMGFSDTHILSSTEQRLSLFASYGLDVAIIEDFNKVCSDTPKDFIYNRLYSECNIRRAVCGYNFRFGKNAAGAQEDFVFYFKSLGASVSVVPPVMKDGIAVSSSYIRKLIEDGDIIRANVFLGHPYQLCLPVTEGQKLGRQMGVPTINQVFPESYAVPRHGVYICRSVIDGISYPSVSNVGIRPTVNRDGGSVNCETHILGYNGSLYGKTVSVDFLSFIRPEKKFDSVDELSAAIHADIAEAEKFFEKTEG